jgi:hypothetical protein
MAQKLNTRTGGVALIMDEFKLKDNEYNIVAWVIIIAVFLYLYL